VSDRQIMEASERVDTRVLQIIYRFEPPPFPVYTGQQVDVYIERDGAEQHQDDTRQSRTSEKTSFNPIRANE